MWGRPGGGGGELCDERSRRQFTLDALQPSVHGVHAHSQREPGRQAPALQLLQCVDRAPPEWNAPGFCGHTEVLTQRGSDAKKPQG